MALVTSANYKTWAGISGTTYDNVIAAVLTATEALVASVLDRRLETAGTDVTEYYDGSGDEVLYLKGWPFVSVTSVSYLSSAALGIPAWTAYDTDTYYFTPDDGRLVRYVVTNIGFPDSPDGCPTWPVGVGNVKVVYQGGYTSSTVPADLVECIYEVMSAIFHGRDGTRTATTDQELRDLIINRAGHYRRGRS